MYNVVTTHLPTFLLFNINKFGYFITDVIIRIFASHITLFKMLKQFTVAYPYFRLSIRITMHSLSFIVPVPAPVHPLIHPKPNSQPIHLLISSPHARSSCQFIFHILAQPMVARSSFKRTCPLLDFK